MPALTPKLNESLFLNDISLIGISSYEL